MSNFGPKVSDPNLTPRAALELSIEHWRHLANGTAHAYETVYSDFCALCTLYRKSERAGYCNHKDFGLCPVAEETGEIGCGSFDQWQLAERIYEQQKNWDQPTDCPAFRLAATAVANFLEELLREKYPRT